MTAILSDRENKNNILEERIITEKNRLLRFIKERNDYIRNLPEIEKKAFIASIQTIKDRKDKIERLLVKKGAKRGIDDLFFFLWGSSPFRESHM